MGFISKGNGFKLEVSVFFCFFYDKINKMISTFPHLPHPDSFTSYKEYQTAIVKWFITINSSIKSEFVPHLPQFLFLYRPVYPLVFKAEKYMKFDAKKSPLCGSNVEWLFKIILDGGPLNFGDVFPVNGPNNQRIAVNDYFYIDDNARNHFVSAPPHPQMFSDYSSFFNAMIEWTRKKPKKIVPSIDELRLDITPNNPFTTGFSYSSLSYSYQTPESVLRFCDAPNEMKTMSISYMHEIYLQHFIYPRKTRPRLPNWLEAFRRQSITEGTPQSMETYSFVAKLASRISPLVDFGPSERIQPPDPTDFIISDSKVTPNIEFFDKNELIKKLIFREGSLSVCHETLSRHLHLFNPADMKIIINLCSQCCSQSLANRFNSLIRQILESSRGFCFFQFIFTQIYSSQSLCSFFGKYGFISVSPLFYSLNIDDELPFQSAYHSLIQSSLLFTISSYFSHQNDIVLKHMTQQLHITSSLLSSYRSEIIKAFKFNKEIQMKSYRVIRLCLEIPYRPFHKALFSPSPINTFWELISDIPGSTLLLLKLIEVFESSGAMNSVINDIMQFDMNLVSKEAILLVPLAKRCIHALVGFPKPLLTRTQIMAQLKSLSMNFDPLCYPLLETIIQLYRNQNLFFQYHLSDQITDKILLCERIAQKISMGDALLMQSLFASFHSLYFPYNWVFADSFWLGFSKALQYQDPHCSNSWDFLREIFDSGTASILPGVFKAQFPSIVLPKSLNHFTYVLTFIIHAIESPDFLILETILAENENHYYETFRFGYLENQNISNSKILEMYDTIHMISTNKKYGKSLYNIFSFV